MSEEKGQISIHTQNILPIIKKWLYAEKEIFVRELVSNAADAIHKLEKLRILGETNAPAVHQRSISKSIKQLKDFDSRHRAWNVRRRN